MEPFVEVVTLAIIATKTECIDRSRSQCLQVANDSARGARAAANLGDLMRDLSRLHTGLCQLRGNLQIFIQKEIPQHSDASLGKIRNELLEPLRR
jgi:hypothetical protein